MYFIVVSSKLVMDYLFFNGIESKNKRIEEN